jgi:glycine/D-amino acid oxidase-like deaminating enzyme
MNAAHAAAMAEAFDRYREAGGDVSNVRFYQGEVAKAKSGIASAACVYEWPAASNHPGKLTQWILSDVIARGARLWTHCPAIKISNCQAPSELRWKVQTPRGVIKANTVVHCTNAYAAYLLPELSGLINPRRAQGHSYIPPASLSGENILKSTMSLRYGPSHYFSVNQLKDGTVILGGQATRIDSDRNAKYMKDRDSFDDSNHNPEQERNSVAEFARLTTRGPSTLPRSGEGLSHVWTGIVGETPDAVPFIGPIEDLEGQWICAGFNGHGESLIFAPFKPHFADLFFFEAWDGSSTMFLRWCAC